MFPVLLLLSCFMYWTAEAALPGQACSATNPCANSICCNGYCSACCDKLHCPKGDYCIVQNPPPSAGLKYQSCFPGNNGNRRVSLKRRIFNSNLTFRDDRLKKGWGLKQLQLLYVQRKTSLIN